MYATHCLLLLKTARPLPGVGAAEGPSRPRFTADFGPAAAGTAVVEAAAAAVADNVAAAFPLRVADRVLFATGVLEDILSLQFYSRRKSKRRRPFERGGACAAAPKDPANGCDRASSALAIWRVLPRGESLAPYCFLSLSCRHSCVKLS
jgi:hypothetical protein